MGCGKSSVGRKLSELLCCPFMDLDDIIEQHTGRGIPEVFVTDGEASFRQLELTSLQDILNLETPKSATILSLGGGAVTTPECAALVHEKTICIYLRTSVDTLVTRLAGEISGRPLLNALPNDKEESISQIDKLRLRIEDLMNQRASTYECTAHIILDTDALTIDEVAHSIIKIINQYCNR